MNETVTKRDLVEQNVEKVVNKDKAAMLMVSADLGGTGFSNMLEVIESAKMMAMAGPMIPEWLQGNPGGCWGIILQSIEWKFSPLSVARMSFDVKGVVGYMAQLTHAVIEARAPLKERLRCEFEGEGPTRVCIVTGTFIGDSLPQVYRSPMIKDINPKNSPLWKNDPDQQLWYFSSRSWCRRYAPDVLLGVYSKDELDDNPAIAEASKNARDVSPGLHARLAGAPREEEGHQDGHAGAELDQIAGSPAPRSTDEAIEQRMEEARDAKPEPKPKPAKAKKADAPKADALADIKTPEDYEAYAAAWIEAGTEVEPMRAQWSRERAKRTDLGVVEEMMLRISNAYNAKIKSLQKAA